MNFRCPVCLFAGLPYPPSDYHICPCCGTEFGNDDVEFSHEQLVQRWINSGAHWFYEKPPADWSPWVQLFDGGRLDLVRPIPQVSMYTDIMGMLEENVMNEPNAIQSPPMNEETTAYSMIG